MIKFEVLTEIAEKLGFPLSENGKEKFLRYEKILKKWSKRINLLSKRELDEIEKHFIDSIFLLPLIEGSELADLGTGAGFPGIPVKIMIPDVTLHLVERSFKKTIFLKNLVRELSLEGVFIHQTDWKDFNVGVDTAFAKATGDLQGLLREIHHIVKSGGKFIIYSSQNSSLIGDPEVFSFFNPLRNSKGFLLVYRV
jgi:16S rRNA (guanine527-N7)-methyltransferase